MEEKNNLGKFIVGGIVGLILLILILGSFGTVSAGQQGVKTRFGKVVGIVPPGLYFKLPVLDSVHKIDVKTRTVNYDKNGKEGDASDTSQLFGASKDLQDVHIGVVVNYHLDAKKADGIFTQYSSTENFEANIIEPIIREVVKSTSAEYTAEELVTKRAEFSDKVNTTLAERFTGKDAVLERFNVTNFEFSPSFTAAIEAKVTATQNAEAARNKLAQTQAEASSTIVQATADAEVIRIKAQAINSQGGADYVQLQAVAKWDGHLPTQMIPGSAVPFINLNNK